MGSETCQTWNDNYPTTSLTGGASKINKEVGIQWWQPEAGEERKRGMGEGWLVGTEL